METKQVRANLSVKDVEQTKTLFAVITLNGYYKNLGTQFLDLTKLGQQGG